MHHELINNASESYPFLIEHLNVKYIPHVHSDIELVYVLDGELEVTIGESAFTLKKEEICVISSGMIHNLYSEVFSRVFVIKLFAPEKLCDIKLNSYILSPGRKCYSAFKENIENIMRENKSKTLGYELAVNSSTQKLLLIILRDMEYTTPGSKTKIKQESHTGFLTSISDFLEKNYSEDFSLEYVAEHFGFTKSYFCHFFKKITGVTFWRYYTIFRLEKSVEMMKNNRMSTFMEISCNAGFKNIRSFNQAFKEYYNTTPREYIKEYYKREMISEI